MHSRMVGFFLTRPKTNPALAVNLGAAALVGPYCEFTGFRDQYARAQERSINQRPNYRPFPDLPTSGSAATRGRRERGESGPIPAVCHPICRPNNAVESRMVVFQWLTSPRLLAGDKRL